MTDWDEFARDSETYGLNRCRDDNRDVFNVNLQVAAGRQGGVTLCFAGNALSMQYIRLPQAPSLTLHMPEGARDLPSALAYVCRNDAESLLQEAGFKRDYVPSIARDHIAAALRPGPDAAGYTDLDERVGPAWRRLAHFVDRLFRGQPGKEPSLNDAEIGLFLGHENSRRNLIDMIPLQTAEQFRAVYAVTFPEAIAPVAAVSRYPDDLLLLADDLKAVAVRIRAYLADKAKQRNETAPAPAA